jgi:hypothetical protein
VEGYIVGTDSRIKIPVTVSTDTLLTRETIEALARDIVGGRVDAYAVTPERATLVSGLRAGDAGIL